MGSLEKRGVGFLSEFIARSKYLEPFFDTNDKTPSWDGYISAHSDGEAITKDNFEGRIPVQIKTSRISQIDISSCKYDFELSDLESYYKDRGVLIFIVGICDCAFSVFFTTLLPSDLQIILEQMKIASTKHKSLVFQRLDTNNLLQIESICRSFLLNRLRQYSTIESKISINESKYLTFYYFPDGTPFADHLLTHSIPIYGKQSIDGVEIFIKNIKFSRVNQIIKKNVVINGTVFFDNYEIVKTIDQEMLKFGQGIYINLTDKLITYQLKGELSEQINDCKFLNQLVKYKTISIDGVDIGSIGIEPSKNAELFTTGLETILKTLTDIQSLLNFLGIIPNKLDIRAKSVDQLDQISRQNLDVLVNELVYSTKTNFSTETIGFHMLKIANLNIGVLIFPNSKEPGLDIIPLFKPINNQIFQSLTNDGKEIRISPYIFLKEDFLRIADNLNLNEIQKSIQQISLVPDYANQVILFSLELIKAYDISHRIEFLDTAQILFYWLHDNNEMVDICIINLLQIIIRTRKLNKGEIRTLIQMQEKYIDDNRILCGINILLENKTLAQLNFDDLSPGIKKEFEEYPIYNWAKNNKILA